MDNIKYYNDNAERYLQSISDVNINSQLDEFLSKIRKGGLILDGGCGTGRDSLYMKRMGYNVIAFDASEKMAQIASETTGIDILVDTFEDIYLEDNYFDGIWCMSSLLHVKKENMLSVFLKLYNSLKENGYFYCSFKMREEDFSEDGRSFSCYTEESFRELISKTDFKIESIVILDDTRKSKKDEKWIYALLKK